MMCLTHLTLITENVLYVIINSLEMAHHKNHCPGYLYNELLDTHTP